MTRTINLDDYSFHGAEQLGTMADSAMEGLKMLALGEVLEAQRLVRLLGEDQFGAPPDRILDIAILDGIRTPFVKAFGPMASVPAQELGRRVTATLLERAGIRGDQIDQVVFGNVASPPEAANVARVIALLAGIPQERPAHT